MFAEVGTLGADPDDRLMSRPEILEPMKRWMREGARQGAGGYTADWIAECGPWGFSLTEVRRPVHVWWGEADRLVGRPHAEYLAAAIPETTLRTYPDEGHLFPLNHWRGDPHRSA
jgi:pimeloyl-ACP methyl ester carboxylesterase